MPFVHWVPCDMLVHKNASLRTHGWELESAEARHASSPASFVIPPAHLRRSLQFGDRVKLLFLFHIVDKQHPGGIVGCERMWVTVIEASGGRYVGLLETRPVSSDALWPNEALAFDAIHIADIAARPDSVEFAMFQQALRDFVERLENAR